MTTAATSGNLADAILYGPVGLHADGLGSTEAADGVPRIAELKTNYQRLGLQRWVSRVKGFCGCEGWLARGDFPSPAFTGAPDQQPDIGNLTFYHELIADLDSRTGHPVSFAAEPRKDRGNDVLYRRLIQKGRALALVVDAEALETTLRISGADDGEWRLLEAQGSQWAACYDDNGLAACVRAIEL